MNNKGLFLVVRSRTRTPPLSKLLFPVSENTLNAQKRTGEETKNRTVVTELNTVTFVGKTDTIRMGALNASVTHIGGRGKANKTNQKLYV